jgi:hypothetical protein
MKPNYVLAVVGVLAMFGIGLSEANSTRLREAKEGAEAEVKEKQESVLREKEARQVAEIMNAKTLPQCLRDWHPLFYAYLQYTNFPVSLPVLKKVAPRVAEEFGERTGFTVLNWQVEMLPAGPAVVVAFK